MRVTNAQAKRLVIAAAGPARFRLPFPPSNNTYYRHVGAKVLLSKRGREYRREVAEAVGLVPMFTRDVAVVAVFHPPDKRRRDLDNLLKGLLDSLQHAGVFLDDSQVKRLDLRFGCVDAPGWADVEVRNA